MWTGCSVPFSITAPYAHLPRLGLVPFPEERPKLLVANRPEPWYLEEISLFWMLELGFFIRIWLEFGFASVSFCSLSSANLTFSIAAASTLGDLGLCPFGKLQSRDGTCPFPACMGTDLSSSRQHLKGEKTTVATKSKHIGRGEGGGEEFTNDRRVKSPARCSIINGRISPKP